MQKLDQYDAALQYGVRIDGDNLTVGNHYITIAIPSSSTTGLNVFGTATAPSTGTITAFYVIQSGASGTAVVTSTTAGTIATVNYGTTVGTFAGTSSITGIVTSGDTVTVANTGAIGTGGSGGGTCTFMVVFQTLL